MTSLTITEAEFQTQVTDLASLLGWRWMHVRRSKVRNERWATATSVPGWPDLFLWHPTQQRVAAVELKSQAGNVTKLQRELLDELEAAGLEVYVWRPSDFDALHRVLAAVPVAEPEGDSPC